MKPPPILYVSPPAEILSHSHDGNEDIPTFAHLYSRKGAFYAPYFPLPQLNWVDFVEWVMDR